MHKKINIFFILFTISIVLTFALLIFIKFDNYLTSLMINNEVNSILIVKKEEYDKIQNKQVLNIQCNNSWYEVNINQTFKNNENYLILLDKLIGVNNEKINKVNIKLQSKNIFGF